MRRSRGSRGIFFERLITLVKKKENTEIGIIISDRCFRLVHVTVVVVYCERKRRSKRENAYNDEDDDDDKCFFFFSYSFISFSIFLRLEADNLEHRNAERNVYRDRPIQNSYKERYSRRG